MLYEEKIRRPAYVCVLSCYNLSMQLNAIRRKKEEDIK
jgi:hypothetical protein